jgi:hypothetical protein
MGFKEVINAPGKSVSLLSKILSIFNLIVGEVMIGSGIWHDITPWGVIEISIALGLLSLPVDISIILKNFTAFRDGAKPEPTRRRSNAKD